MPVTLDKKISQADDLIRGFVKSLESSGVEQKQSPRITYDDFLKDRMLIIHSIRVGVPYSLFSSIRAITPFTEKDWAEFLNISTKSLQRYKNDKNFVFKPIHSEKIIELAEVTQLGLEVFGSSEKFYLWLNTSSFALGKMKPQELLKDSYGKEMVMNELNRIDQGIFV